MYQVGINKGIILRCTAYQISRVVTSCCHFCDSRKLTEVLNPRMFGKWMKVIVSHHANWRHTWGSWPGRIPLSTCYQTSSEHQKRQRPPVLHVLLLRTLIPVLALGAREMDWMSLREICVEFCYTGVPISCNILALFQVFHHMRCNDGELVKVTVKSDSFAWINVPQASATL